MLLSVHPRTPCKHPRRRQEAFYSITDIAVLYIRLWKYKSTLDARTSLLFPPRAQVYPRGSPRSVSRQYYAEGIADYTLFDLSLDVS